LSITQGTIFENLEQIRKTVIQACKNSHRDPQEIRIVAISKGFDSKVIREACNAGITDIGENYIQEALVKQDALSQLPIHWHFTGHLQRNKIPLIVQRFELIHSVDSMRLAESLSAHSLKTGESVTALIQLKTSANIAHGFSIEEIRETAQSLSQLEGLKPKGIMTMAPASQDHEAVRASFRAATEIFHVLKRNFGSEFQHLSMGMSDDYDIAVEEGATMLRLGRAIFGERRGR